MLRQSRKHVKVAERQRRSRRRGVIEDLEGIFGPAPICQGEDELAYLDLASRIRAALQPRDVIEEMYARDIADLLWEASRFKRAIATMQNKAFMRAALHVIRQVDPSLAPPTDLAGLFDAKITSTLTRMGVRVERVHADSLPECLGEVERLKTLLMKTEIRRDAVMREFDRRRDRTARMSAPLHDEETALLKALPKPLPGT